MTDTFKPLTFEDLENLPPESRESAYRRGYRDGWVQAVDAMHDLMFKAGLNRQAAYDKAWDHWQGELLKWQQNHENGFELPPGVKE